MKDKLYELQHRLKTLEYIDGKIEALCLLHEKWEARAEAVSPKLDEKVQGGNKCKSVVEDVAIKIIEIETELVAEITKLENLKQNIKAVIKSLDNDLQKRVLEFRYIYFYRIEKIADIMNYDRRQIYRIHDNGLRTILKNKNLLNLLEI